MYNVNGKKLTISKADMNSFEREHFDLVFSVLNKTIKDPNVARDMSMWLIQYSLRTDVLSYGLEA